MAEQKRLGPALEAVSSSFVTSDGPPTGLLKAEKAIAETLLWRLRVLAGWLPPAGTPLLRAGAAIFERDNILGLARLLLHGTPEPAPFDLGGLATAWSRLRHTQGFEALCDELTRTPWGRVDATSLGQLRDQLTVAWLRRLSAVAWPTRAWAALYVAQLVARLLLVDKAEPTTRLIELAHPFLGDAWPTASDLPSLVSALPPSAGVLLRGLGGTNQLWLAEARLARRIEADALHGLRTARPGPEVVIMAVALLGVDSWRVRVALADADAGDGPREVLDVVA